MIAKGTLKTITYAAAFSAPLVFYLYYKNKHKNQSGVTGLHQARQNGTEAPGFRPNLQQYSSGPSSSNFSRENVAPPSKGNPNVNNTSQPSHERIDANSNQMKAGQQTK
jgi:hypothetical protein